MKQTWVSILVVCGLLVLLVSLAWLQYVWLGQISDATRERLQNRLQTDTRRFAEDFNKEIRNAYFFFQVDPADWLKNDWTTFNIRYRLWQTQTAYPQLIKDFYFVRRGETYPFRYDAAAQDFKPTDWTDDLRQVEAKILSEQKNNSFEPIVINEFTLLLPNYAGRMRERVFEHDGVPPHKADLSGYLVIRLDENVIDKMLADLNQRYFPIESAADEQPASFRLTVLNKANSKIIYPKNKAAAAIAPEMSDASIPLFDLSMNNFTMVVNSKVFSDGATKTQSKILKPPPLPPPLPRISKEESVKVQLKDSPRAELAAAPQNGLWLLNVQHTDGSLENFISHTRRKNLAISFGILMLLAASIAFVFLSARRAQFLAQKQLDFVSAVSHEFRTPLAVIYSAGENLTDGVITSEKQISQYGNLIKREGKKLSAMVEQILEFAGARSGRKKYDMRETDVEQVIENALAECQSLINDKGFTVEKEISENLPKISADAVALSHSIQNLIINAVKYSDRNKWIRVSASNGGGQVKIAVEDRGIGISPRDAANIFTPFFRAKSVVDAQIHGNGLGLSLVRQTVKAHGGDVSVESEIGKGSKFIIHLPLNQ